VDLCKTSRRGTSIRCSMKIACSIEQD